MATCKAVVVLCPNGRKVNVKIAPNATISKILDEVCRKQGVNSKEHRIKHQRKILDNDLSVRFSNLPNNAHLELVQETAPVRQVGSSCTVALQLESGERLVHSFQPSTTLWEILTHWDSQKDREHEARLTERYCSNMLPLAPVCVYMAEEIQGEEKLRSTTLQSIGLSSGRAVIRLLHRKASGGNATISEHSLAPTLDQTQGENNRHEEQSKHSNINQDTSSSSQSTRTEQICGLDTEDNKSLSVTSDESNLKSNHSEKVDETVKMNEDMEVVTHAKEEEESSSQTHDGDLVTTEQTKPTGSGGESVDTATHATHATADATYYEDIPAIDFKAMLAQEREKLIGRRQEEAQLRSQAGSALPKRPRLERLPEPLFPNFKFPDGEPEEERGKACPSSDPDFVQEFSCQRHPVVYSLDDPSTCGPKQEDLPDEFFEVTVDDLRRMLTQLNQDRIKQETAPLLTKAQREAAEKAQMERYTKVVIRIYFPDRLVLQGFFQPNEKVSAITEFVRHNLEAPTTDFYIYVAPPKRILSKLDVNIYEAKLCPAAVVYFGSEEKKDHFLSAHHIQAVSSLVDAEQVVHREMSSSRKKSNTSVDTVSHVAATSKSHPSPAVEGKTDSTTSASKTPAGPSAGKGTVPKWFKMGKK